MTARPICCLAAIAVSLLAYGSQPAAQGPPTAERTFTSRVDLITIDVAAVDKQGHPVEDLRAGDFTVKVDGRSRPVVSAQLITATHDTAPPASDLPSLTVSTNVGVATGRRVVVAVDQTTIVPGSISAVMRSASRFVDQLVPADYAAVIAFPEPGPRVDFTTDKAAVRRAMERIVGLPAKMVTTAFNLSVSEAQAIDSSERKRVDFKDEHIAWETVGPTMRKVLQRGCRGLTYEELQELIHSAERDQCVRDLSNESMTEAQEIRSDARISLERLASFLKELAALDGPKTMVLVSAGIVAEDLGLLEEVTRLAADARTTIHVIAVDRERERDYTDLANNQSSMQAQDRSLERRGLEMIADRTGGELLRVIGQSDPLFDRLALEMSASYVLAVERRDGDPDRQQIDVEVKRRGVVTHATRSVVAAATSARRPPEEILRDALGSPLPVRGVTLRLSTFARRDPAAGSYLLHLAAQVGEPGTAPGAFTIGYAVLDHDNHVVTSRGNRVELTPSGRAGEPLPYDTAITLLPGAYTVRLAVVDAEGRHGTVTRAVDLPVLPEATLTTSDLIVGAALSDGDAMHPAVEPHVDGRIAAYLELYPPDTDRGALTVTLEIAEGDASPALTTVALNVGAGAHTSWRVASGAIDASLLPGRYIARASVRRDGVPVQRVSRPFVLERSAGGAAGTATIVRPTTAALSPEVKSRTAGYVGAFVHSLSNVVGQEDFVLTGPDRRITSEFLLVQHPASPGDLLTYRDVTRVNGVDVADREERLADLFLKPAVLVRDRVRQITQAAEQQVPSVLNPIFVLAFLQGDFQSRFELTVSDAGREWPSTVKAVAFVETARPTIFRGGLVGDQDVPVRGTAWIETATGRVLQTELHVNTGKATVVVTRFALDPRLQIMVPEQMRTQNPNGVATYSNFRRFTVQTDTAIAP